MSSSVGSSVTECRPLRSPYSGSMARAFIWVDANIPVRNLLLANNNSSAWNCSPDTEVTMRVGGTFLSDDDHI